MRESKFYGGVYFELLAHKVIAKRTTNNRKRGAESSKATQMDRVKFNYAIIEVLHAIVRKPLNARRIWIIVDVAGGHGVEKHGQRGLEKSLTDARNWIKPHSMVD